MTEGLLDPAMVLSLIPIFNGENYEFWSIKMNTFFFSQDLGDLVESGYVGPEDAATLTTAQKAELKDNRKKDSKALFVMQQAIHESFFSRIVAAKNSKEAWRILQEEFQGSNKVITVKLQTLYRDFENHPVKSGESIQEYFSRVTVINQMRTYGEDIEDVKVVQKILRSIPTKFDHVVAAIEESKNLSVISINELMGSLQAHEQRINRPSEKTVEHAFQLKLEVSPKNSKNPEIEHSNVGGGQGREVLTRGRGRGR